MSEIIIKNLADFKKAIKPGTIIVGERFGFNPAKMPARKIAISQSNSFAFEGTPETNGEKSWCEYDKAGCYTFEGNKVHIYTNAEKNEKRLTYEIISVPA